jgi:ubiquinone biosynthesis protein COQ9
MVSTAPENAMENKDMDANALRESLLDAVLTHVAFDGWSHAAMMAGAADAGIAPAMVRLICPRGAVDLASDYHRRGDAAMLADLARADLAALRYRDRVALAVRLRLCAADRELVRRGAALFALPQNGAVGARLVWGTADAIWTALGDTSDDVNWYTKRAILSGVYSSSVLYWLGDDSDGHAATWDFVDRRIDDVMQFEKFKARMRDNPLAKTLLAGPLRLVSGIRAPGAGHDDLPGKTWG